MKYIHIYEDNSYCESNSFKDTVNTIVLTDDQYNELGKTLKFSNGKLIEMTEEEKTQAESELAIADKKKRINELKSLLQATDYQAIKYAEGEMPNEEYAPVKELRKGWRKEINDIEALLSIE